MGAFVVSRCIVPGTNSAGRLVSGETALRALSPKKVGQSAACVVSTAEQNIAKNLLAPGSVIIEAGFGDLLSPLSHLKPRYDLIYENLPNVPILDAALMDKARVSSSHVPPRTEPTPAYLQEQMLTLHYLALKQARGFLNPGGSVLSMLGARVPLAVFVSPGTVTLCARRKILAKVSRLFKLLPISCWSPGYLF